MKKRCLNNGGREKAFWGALIPAITSLIGTGLGIASQSSAQRRAMEEERRLRQQQLEREQLNQTANTLNNYFATSTVDDRDYEYAKGGRRRLRNAGVMLTDGGPVVNVNTGEAMYPGDIVYPGKYINLGAKHNQKNAQGGEGTGWITPNGRRFETEANETDIVTPNEVMVFSARNKKNGISYADRALSGENPNRLMREQLKDKSRTLGSGRSKAMRGAIFTTPDYIGLGTNVLGSILSGVWGSRAYDSLANELDYKLPEYVDESYVAGPTRVYDEAKRAAIRRQDINARNDILRNTASANVGLDRSQTVGTNAMYETMKVADETLNKNIELRQANAERQQAVRGRNAAARNAYYNKIADIYNNRAKDRLNLMEGKLRSNVGMIQGIGSAIGGFLQQGIDNYENKQGRIATTASSKYSSAKLMARMGYDYTPEEVAGFYNDALSNYNRTGSDIDYDDVQFWGSRISPRQFRRYGLQTAVRRPNVTRNSILNAVRGTSILNTTRPNYLNPTGNLAPIRI